MWLLREGSSWDEFGWRGSGCRNVLVHAIRALPDKEDELIREYMSIDPSDRDSLDRFTDKYVGFVPEAEEE